MLSRHRAPDGDVGAELDPSQPRCGSCGEHKPRREYSQHQYRSKSAPRCRACVSTLMLARMDRCAPDNDVCDAPRIDETVGRILMITAFSEDYLVGHVCSAVNRSYAERHGYDFIEARHTPSRRAAPRNAHTAHMQECFGAEEMLALIAPRKHLTWYRSVCARVHSIETRKKK